MFGLSGDGILKLKENLLPTEGPVEIVENDDELEIGIAAGCCGAKRQFSHLL